MTRRADTMRANIDMMEHNARSLARCLGGKEMP